MTVNWLAPQWQLAGYVVSLVGFAKVSKSGMMDVWVRVDGVIGFVDAVDVCEMTQKGRKCSGQRCKQAIHVAVRLPLRGSLHFALPSRRNFVHGLSEPAPLSLLGINLRATRLCRTDIANPVADLPVSLLSVLVAQLNKQHVGHCATLVDFKAGLPMRLCLPFSGQWRFPS